MRAAYLSYDGALDPLGATQVVPYLEGLSRTGIRFELMTFEKTPLLDRADRVSAMESRLARSGIAWHRLRYHKSPRVPATLWDILRGSGRLRRLVRRGSFDLLHCRGEITPIMVRWSGVSGRLLLDMRGFWADERVDAGSWAAGGIVDRAVREMEKRNLERSSRVVVLTQRGREVLRGRGVRLPIDVIPTCVDMKAFEPPSADSERLYDLVYFGSVGGWYMTEEMIRFLIVMRDAGVPIRALFLTNNADATTTKRLQAAGVTVASAPPDDVPRWLSKCRAAYFFIRPTASKIASCPTKLAEALAMGLPILTGSGIGDVDTILQEGEVGFAMKDFSDESFREGWRALQQILADPQARARCRHVAETRLSLDEGVRRYRSTYDALLTSPM